MQNSECIEIFESYLANEKKASANTLSSYLRDVRQLGEYLDIHHDAEITEATEEQLSEYIVWMKGNGKSVATVSRCIASIKCLYSYLRIKQLIDGNPASKLVPDKGEHKLPQILSSREVDLLLEQPQCTDAKGYRDKAMLELLYATGIRVTELIDLDISDVNLTAGVVRCRSRDKERDKSALGDGIAAADEGDVLQRGNAHLVLYGAGEAVAQRLGGPGLGGISRAGLVLGSGRGGTGGDLGMHVSRDPDDQQQGKQRQRGAGETPEGRGSSALFALPGGGGGFMRGANGARFYVRTHRLLPPFT